ncbi:hypothetical protein MRB53_003607 [Persea americana]|uniref:Uncharacterized protein n=1 Tax=Persea americana TaxID=3435 RepID=A0ACC2MXZ8_PERAE|nr:hypothetical protein MRB53_003607 [Persea americana]
MDQANPKPQQSHEKFDPNTLPPFEEKPPPPTTKSTRQLSFRKPKSRLVESTPPRATKPTAESEELPDSATIESSSDEDDTPFKDAEKFKQELQKKKRKVGWRTIAQWVLFFLTTACLATTLTVDPWKEKLIWGLALWKWTLMVLVVSSGRLVSGWLVSSVAFIIECNFMRHEKVLYFVYGLRRSVQNCVWLGLVLLSWYIMFYSEIGSSSLNHGFLNRVWRALIAVTIAAVIWLIKIILVKFLASSFHVATFFGRMKESVSHYIILEKLLGLPLDEVTPTSQREKMGRSKTMPGRLSRRMEMGGGSGSRPNDMEKLRKMSRKNASPFTVKWLVSHVMSTGLSSISTTVDRTMEDYKKTESDMTSEWEAKLCAQKIFENVAKAKAGENVANAGDKYIEGDDLLRFLDKEEVQSIPLFHGTVENRKIKKKYFRKWVVEAYRERKALALSLNDTKTAVQQLHKLASALVIVIIIVMSLLVMGVASSKVLVFVTSQLVLVAFMFGNTCKTIFESIIFVFVVHPFDATDRCVIDGVQMIVEEMNILTTVFLRFDNEKIYYPNSVLLTKPISNFNRSPEMSDNIEFAIDVSTPADTFMAMKEAIKKYIDGKSKHWQSKHHVVVKDIENVNKMKIVLFVTHTINYQNYIEKLNRRSELVLELKKIFEVLGIKYNLLPQQVHLNEIRMVSATT